MDCLSPATSVANQRSPLVEGCSHWLRGVSGRDAVWTGTEWAGDRELRLGFRLHHRRVVNPFEGRAEATGGDSVRCFSCTEAPGLSPPRIGACCLELSPSPVPSCWETGAAPQRLPVDLRSSHRSPVQSERLKAKGEQGAKGEQHRCKINSSEKLEPSLATTGALTSEWWRGVVSLNKWPSITDNRAHPLHDRLHRQRSTLSNRLTQHRCHKDRYRSSFLSDVITTYNSSSANRPPTAPICSLNLPTAPH
ncbi:uncharacterized protein LOC132386152 [Hypanus sabinus]|uniref:uncharacterized protein LOC132386152 n=1 Tax=Hypanus sabinus TaxID=79690 RepID=UPI0028C3D976|nr:uncharacterized protein LOC132386152 [Hypanus sabinus]